MNINTDFKFARAPVIAFLFLSLSAFSMVSYSQEQGDFLWECPSSPQVEAPPPSIKVTSQSTGHLVSWKDYCLADPSVGKLNETLNLNKPIGLKGYEVHYDGESQNLTFGATGDSWLDDITNHHALNDYTLRTCFSKYRVRAITTKHKGINYVSNWVYANGDCNTVPNRSPAALISAPSNVDLNSTIDLIGSGSSDPDGDILSYNWSSNPTSGITLLKVDEENAVAEFLEAGSYTITLTVTDPDGASTEAYATIEAVADGVNLAPNVFAGSNQSLQLVDAKATTTLEGVVSDDNRPVGATLSSAWELLGTSDCGTNICDNYLTWLSDPNQTSVTVNLSAVGTYNFRLTANDTELQQTDTMTVTVSENVGGLGTLIWVGDDSTTTLPDEGQCEVSRTFFDSTIREQPPLWATEFNNPSWEKDEDGTRRWNTAYAWGPEEIINNESQYYVDALGIHQTTGNEWSPFQQVSVDNEGFLVIQAAPGADAGRVNLGPAANTQKYLSGVMTTRGEVDGDLTYGYFEARLRTAPGNGTWTAFWLNHSSFRKSNEPEADVIEYLGQSPSNIDCETGASVDGYCYADHPQYTTDEGVVVDYKTYNTYDTQYHTYWYGKGRREERSDLHFTNRDKNPQKPGDPYAPEWCGAKINFAQEFHTYGFLWTPTQMVWYIDDIEVMRVDPSDQFADTSDMPIADENMYLVLNLALGNNEFPWVSWPGAPDAWTESQFNDNGYNKISMAIDYVRVYSLP